MSVFHRSTLERALRRVSSAGAFEQEITLTGEEAAQLAEWIRTEKYRTRCKRKHLEDLEAEGRLLPTLKSRGG